MLSEILLTPTKKKPTTRRGGITMSGLFPCPYYLHCAHTNKYPFEPNPETQLRLTDGWWQEEQTVKLLEEKGVLVKNRQLPVRIGNSRIPGHIDGTIELDKMRLFEHKAMSFEYYTRLIQKGLSRFPGMRAQVQAYMKGLQNLGMPVTETNFFAKHKDSCHPFDLIEKIDEGYIGSIIEWADAIILDNWVPKPKEIKECKYCWLDCFGPVLDFSWMKEANCPDVVKKWHDGYKMKKVGEMLIGEARDYFIGVRDKNGDLVQEGLIGDKELLLVGDLEVKKIIQHRFEISRERVLEEFGPEGLIKVGESKDIETYRIGERKV